jgi:hypothetical protein
MLPANDDELRGDRGVCVSLRRVGDVIELAFDSVGLEEDDGEARSWKHRGALGFVILTPEEFNGKMSMERMARFGDSILSTLFHLDRPRGERSG